MSDSDSRGRSSKHEAGRQRVPLELRSVFDELVEDYQRAGTKHYGIPFISYEILADLIIMGWRPAAQSVPGRRA